MSPRVGVDTGGTFTDVVVLGDDGGLRMLKLPSTPDDPARAVIEGVRGAGEVVHSTTVATNALLERRGGSTVLVTTAGFEDVLALGRQARPSLYALHPVVAPPLVEDSHRLGVDERLDPRGGVLRAPSPEALAALVEQVRALQPASIAVCLLHAYANPAHERAVASALAVLGVPISLSSEVLPLPREFERTSTTVVDAYVRPVVAPYFARLSAVAGRLRITQSNGGATSATEAAARPVRTLLSGPAAGVVGALAVARAAGVRFAITLDMGGTSTDVALIADGEVAITDEAEVGGCALQLPMLAVHTVGAGGGSIARLDSGGALKVGPRSAGAQPGPACYARGGSEPTVTDADLVLGRLSAKHFLGGEMALDGARARAALASLGTALGKPAEAAAEDVVAVADAVMARAIKTISVERGHDPAHFTLMPFGGAGGMHACAVARELGVRKVLVPPSPGLLCAYGALAADVVHDRIEAHLVALEPGGDARSFEIGFARLENEAHTLLERDGVGAADRTLTRTCALRYRGQSFELQLPAHGDLAAAFHAAHQARYGHALPERAVELCSLRVRAVGRTAPIPPPSEPAEAGEALLGRGTTIFGGRAYGASIWSRRRLAVGTQLTGPAIIVEYSATTFLPPDARAEIVPSGSLAIFL